MDMHRTLHLLLPAGLALALALAGCAPAGPGASPTPPTSPTPATPTPTPTPTPMPTGATDAEAAPRPAAAGTQARPYNRVITTGTQSKPGLFTTHQVADRLYFEIPRSELGKDQIVLIRNAAGGATEGFFGGGNARFIVWEWEGSRIVVRERSYNVTADPSTAISSAVNAMQAGPIIAAFNVETFGADSAVVIDVTRLFTTNVPRFASVNGVVADRSYLESVHAFDEVINVQAWQTGTQQGGGEGGEGGGGAAQPVTALVHYSIRRLPEQPMQPRLWDPRVGINSIRVIDYGRPTHGAEARRYIRRYRLEKQDPNAAVSEPREKIVFWIDPATPEWLVPWVKAGVEEWLPAYEDAGFRNAIEGRLAPTPEQDPSFSIYDARHSVVYWRPSTVANATGGQQVDPRTGEILKAEVNMYHNVLNLLRNWYFTQVSPLDARAQVLPFPDSLMGRLVQYVVSHEIGHAIGFPHNMKASAMYPADSIRSVDFLRRKGSHVATLMDYSRFNYVAQPEDNIPPELLIPKVGPYDHFAIMWQNTPIPGASTPDDERATLEQWSRMQDTIPWFRFSTSDASQDPYDLTEAVGDEDAVSSSTLGLRNLRRIMDTLLRVAEQPGEDYSLLSELYSNVVSQWGRYNGHVATLIGGADTQERLGTGLRFTPMPRARQQEAMRYLNEYAFQVPDFIIRPDILSRIEQEGIVARVRNAQNSTMNTVLSRGRLDRLMEYEALAARSSDAYTVADLLADLRAGVWSELAQPSPRIDLYRRNLQRSYLAAVDRTLNPPPPAAPAPAAAGRGSSPPPPAPWTSDVRPLLRDELQQLDALLRQAVERTTDSMTRLHLRDLSMEIAGMMGRGR
jgi:hypothetical protein